MSHQDSCQNSVVRINSNETPRSGHNLSGTPWRSMRYTPYNRKPTARSLRSSKRTGDAGRHTRTVQRRSAAERPQDDTSLNCLVKKTWHVYRVSPLYKFSHDTADLQNYSRVLSGHLEAEYNKGMAVMSESEKANMAVFSVFKGLRKSESEPEAIQIQLMQKPKRDGREARTVHVAILCCVEAGFSALEKVKRPFVLLPVMLFRGPVLLSKYLSNWLECQFDCSIHRTHFAPLSMSWMVAMWAGSVQEGSSNPVMLQYKVPEEVEGLHHITLNVNSHDCKQLWDCIHSMEKETFTNEEVVKFMKSLEAHFYHHFKVNISAMPLCKVGTAIAVVGSDGKIKILSPQHMHQVLGLVTEVILEMNTG